jgi:hypothetical protein
MIDPYTNVVPQLPAAPAGVAARGERAFTRGYESGIAFDATIARGSSRGSARAAFFGEGEATFTGEVLPPASGTDSFFHAPSGGDTAAFLAQQIAQEMVASEYVAPEQAAAAAAGSYQAVPDSRVSYDGPFIALDITV